MSDKKPEPPYTRYAFANPYNIAILGGFASAAMLTGNWWLGMAGAGVEALWMLFAPDSRLLRKVWFDRRHEEELAAAKKQALEETVRLLPASARERCLSLQTRQEQINRLANENPAFTVDLLGGELEKLGNLVNAFVELALTGARYQEYLTTIDINLIEADERRYKSILDKSKEGDSRQLAQKNLAVIAKRKEKYAEIRGYLSSSYGQMELIDNTFRLLADQIVTMHSPKELGGQLDELLDGVEAVRQTTRETDKLLQAIEH